MRVSGFARRVAWLAVAGGAVLVVSAGLMRRTAGPADAVGTEAPLPARPSGPAGPTPAELRIEAAERAVRNTPSADAYNDLALAFARRARETADPQHYRRAEQAIERSLELSPDNFEALKMRTWVLLGQHEFARARDLARALNARMPDDLLVYGFLTDAYAELGQYKEAEEACQWMLDLRPGNIPAFTRAAYLRELFGDIEGAVELMRQAYDRSPPYEVEDRAWLLTQLAHLARMANQMTDADRLLEEALSLFPDYHYALGEQAKVRTLQGHHAQAIALEQRRYALAPHPENLYALARALDRDGRTADAREAYREFEQQALAESDKWDNANRELTLYYTDVARRPADALRIARLEFDRRQDVYTLDAYAWALHANRRTDDARVVMRRALDVGIKDPDVLAHASAIGR